MHEQQEPAIDGWYRDNMGRVFQVVAADNDTVELQHFSGEVEEITLSAWFAMALESIDPPEDWTGAYDDVARDDLGDTGLATHPEDWNGPWDELDREGY